MRVFILTLFLLNLGGELLHAQTPEQNHQKYWYYRWRLRNHFMKIGPGQGESLIASERGIINSGVGPDAKTHMTFGDQTFNLGYYMAILALEYDQLAGNNQNTDQTTMELYYALHALNRLDINAESMFRSGFGINDEPNPQLHSQPGSLQGTSYDDLNGFFVRDDVDSQFYMQNFDHFNSDKIESQAELMDWDMKSDWWHDSQLTFSQKQNEEADSEMSQDQVYTLMLGMRMIYEFIPDALTYENLAFQDGETSIKQEALNILKRILSHCNGTSQALSLGYWWRIKNPEFDEKVKRGHTMAGWAGGVHRTIDEMGLLENVDWDYDQYYTNNYSAAAVSIFNAQILVQNPMAVLGSTYSDDNAHMFGLLAAMAGVSSQINMMDAGYDNSEMYHIPLIREILHGGSHMVPDSKFTDLLNTAPCEGPYNYGYPGNTNGYAANSAPYEWSTNNRLLHPKRRGLSLTGEQNNMWRGEYPGLDYMLYHNLYYAIHDDDYASPFDLVNTQMEKTLPFFDGTLGVGTTYNPLNLNSFNTITASNIINPNGYNVLPNGNTDVTYRAGYTITLEPGFEVKPGADFVAYVDPFECATDGTYKSNGTFGGLTVTNGFKPHDEPQLMANQNSNDHSDFDDMMTDRKINTSSDEMMVYPNPSTGKFNVNFDSPQQGRIEVMDAKGTVIVSTEVNSNLVELDLSGYSKGLYILKFHNSNEVMTKRVVIR